MKPNGYLEGRAADQKAIIDRLRSRKAAAEAATAAPPAPAAPLEERLSQAVDAITAAAKAMIDERYCDVREAIVVVRLSDGYVEHNAARLNGQPPSPRRVALTLDEAAETATKALYQPE